ncbi:coiled-coil domain-containing protein 30 isoform X3 [Pseudophryne corroboree]|uniref:coiled-coil domain-containing protein 30 isoform X3 n=1 Tax=Pseudophryne corroboree TaxID=495146 RepID=UPI00308215EB
MDKVHFELEDIVSKLKEQGLNPGTSTEEYLCFLWNLYQIAENKLQTATSSLEELRLQQAEEMKEVESYVAHIRSLTEEREALTTDFEKENIQLRIELEKLRLQQESQLKEVEEMLDQEGLNEIASSSPSEQVAYLLVERATLLEKLEALEQKTYSHSESDLKRQTFDEELDKERKIRECTERDLNEAAQRLKMAHDEIRKLTDDLLIKKSEINENEHVMKEKQEEYDVLCQDLKTLKDNDSVELQRAKEHNDRLDKEILSLRQRVRSLDSERKKHMEQYEKSENDSATNSSATKQNLLDNPELHKKCRLDIEAIECQNKQLLHKLQKLQCEHEEIVERNEELESILGESQNRTKEQVDYLECEIAGLQRTIMNLESELTELAEQREKKESKNTVPEKMSSLQKELDTLRSKLKGVHNDLKSTEPENINLHLKIEQLGKEKHLQDNKVSDLMEQCKKLQVELSEQKSHNEGNAKQACQQLEEKVKDLENEKDTMSITLSEHKKKCEILQRHLHEETKEKKSLQEENLQLRQDVTVSRQDLQAKREENSRLKQELSGLQEQVSRYHSFGDGAEHLAGDSLVQQQYEEIRQLRQDLHRVQNVCSSAEKELRYERDKNLNAKKQHFLLQKENTKLSAEVNDVKQKFSYMTATCSSLETELDQRQQKIKEMELEILKRNQNSKVQSSLLEKLEQEKSRAVDAEKMILVLQQQLRASQHQLLLLQTQVAEKYHLEEEVKKTREGEAKLKVQLQEEQMQRKILDQRFEEVHQEIKVLHEQEISLTQRNCALQFKLHQQESKLLHLDDEKKTYSTERTHCENTNQKLSEELFHLQQEKGQLHKEYENILKQLDDYIRKYNERQLRHKAKISNTKEAHLSEINKMDSHIKQLEMELSLSRRQAEKKKQWISKITAENDHLHEEKRHLIQKITEQEASEQNHKWKLLSAQNRARILDVENKQLQENLLQLYNQVGLLERVLKKLQALNLTDITKMIPSECLLRPDAVLKERFSQIEASSSTLMLKVIDDAKLEQTPEKPLSLSLSRSETSEVGYLNVVSPRAPITSPEQSVMPVLCSKDV